MAFVVLPNGKHIPLIALQPNAPIVEKFIYFTDIMTSTNGTESRIPIRTDARIQYEYEYPTDAITQDPRMYNVMYGALRQIVAIPVWHQAVRLASDISFGESSFTVATSTEFIDLKNGDFVLLWNSDTSFKILSEVTVSGEDKNIINVSTPLDEEFSADKVWVMPIRSAYIIENATKKTAGISSTWSVEYEILDEITIAPDVPPQVVWYDAHAYDAYMSDAGKSGRDATKTFSAEVDRVDFNIGKYFKRTSWLNSRIASNEYFLMDSLEEVYQLKKRFRRHYGRNKEFLTLSRDINVRIKSVSGTKIIVHPDDYFYYRKHNMLVFTLLSDNSRVVRKVTGWTAVDDSNLELTLDASPPALEDIFYVSYLAMYRLDSDTLSIEYREGKSSATIRLLELKP